MAWILLKASVLLVSGLVAERALRHASARSRHGVWTCVFCGVLAMPILPLILPELQVPVPSVLQVSDPSEPSNTPVIRDPVSTRTELKASVVVPSATPRRPDASSASPALDLGWLTLPIVIALIASSGAVIAVSMLLLSMLRTRRLSRTADEIIDQEWRVAADTLALRLGLRRRVRLLASDQITTPMAGGLWRPVIFLPPSAFTWNDECRDVVLAHEVAHLAGHDPLRHLVARLAVAFYWFHPLFWMAATRATMAREQACDEAVLALGTRRSAYARVLLELAESMHPSPPRVAALPMVDRSVLEKRLMAILNDETRNVKASRGVLPLLALIVLTLSSVTAQPFVEGPPPHKVVTAADDPDDMPTQSSTAQPAKPAKPVDKVIRVSQDITDLACWPPSADRDSFVGSRSVRSTDGRNVIDQQIGMRGTDRLILKSFGDLRLCMVAEGIGDRDWSVPPSQWISRARRVVMEAQRGTSLQRMEIEGGRTLWSVASRAQTADAAADQWRDRMLAVFDTTWEISSLRGRESSLRGQISSIRGQESSLRGQISSYRGIVSSYRGQISSIQGGESSLRGEISAIQGRESSLRGAISSERGAISSLRASDYRSTAADRARIDEMVKRHEDRITIIERQLREFNAPARIAAVEKQIAAGEVDRKIAAVEAEIRAFDVDGKVAAIEKQIAELDVTGKVAAIEREIAALDADRRVRDLEQRRDAQLAALEKTLAAIK